MKEHKQWSAGVKGLRKYPKKANNLYQISWLNHTFLTTCFIKKLHLVIDSPYLMLIVIKTHFPYIFIWKLSVFSNKNKIVWGLFVQISYHFYIRRSLNSSTPITITIILISALNGSHSEVNTVACALSVWSKPIRQHVMWLLKAFHSKVTAGRMDVKVSERVFMSWPRDAVACLFAWPPPTYTNKLDLELI